VASDKFVKIGRLGAPFGVQGWQHIHSYTSPSENILQYSHWYIWQQGNWEPIKVVASKNHGAKVLVQLQGIEDRTQAARLVNAEIAIERQQLAALTPEEFYWTDLEGLQVKTITGETLGHIFSLYRNAGTDVMIVKSADKERHIPFLLHDTIVSVNFDTQEVITNWDPALP